MIEALLELTKLQIDRNIVIKRCDKGAGIILLDFEEYMNACYVHFNSKLTMEDGSTKEFYTKMGNDSVEKASRILKCTLEEAFDNQIISKGEYKALNPDGKKTAKFNCTFKMHKPHVPMKAPAEGPLLVHVIISWKIQASLWNTI